MTLHAPAVYRWWGWRELLATEPASDLSSL